MKRLASSILAAAIVIAGVVPGMAQGAGGCAVVARIAGSWTGGGSVQRSPGADPDPVRCRLRIEWRDATRVMKSTLDCRGIDLDFKLWGSINVSASGGRLMGAFVGTEGLQSVTARGQCRGAALMLQLKAVEPKPGAPVSSDFTITLSPDGNTLTNLIQTRLPGSQDKWRSLSISFKR